MPPARSPSSRRPRWVTRILLAASIVVAAGCGSHAASRAGGSDSPLITADDWNPPAATGPASTAKFCTLLTTLYRHMGQLPYASDTKVKEQIVTDYVQFAPTLIAAAPPAVAPAARLYLTGVAGTLARLVQAGLDPAKLKGTQADANVFSPAFAAASRSVLGYSQTYCHYTIGG